MIFDVILLSVTMMAAAMGLMALCYIVIALAWLPFYLMGYRRPIDETDEYYRNIQ